MRILVTDGMDKTAMAQLRKHGHEVVEQFYEPDQLGEALRGFDVAVVRSKTKVRKEHIDAAKGGQLKLIIRGGVGLISLFGTRKEKITNDVAIPLRSPFTPYPQKLKEQTNNTSATAYCCLNRFFKAKKTGNIYNEQRTNQYPFKLTSCESQ